MKNGQRESQGCKDYGFQSLASCLYYGAQDDNIHILIVRN